MATYRLDYLVGDTMFVAFIALSIIGLVSFVREYLVRRQQRKTAVRHFIVKDGELQ